MPFTLYRYILWEIIKLLVVSTSVLLFVISFAAAIKPMNDGLLGPVGLVKFVLYSAPTMLTFALPFGAAFASTVVFLRMASDNEILVCRASGMSYLMIMLPVLGLGMVIMLGQFYLDNYVIPRFYLMAEMQLERDMTRFMVTQVRKRSPVTFARLSSGMVLYADEADDTQPPPVIPGSMLQPNKLVVLKGVAVAIRDRDGHVSADGTAEQADLLLYRINNQSWVTVRLEHVMYYHADRNEFGFVPEWPVPPMKMPNFFHDRMQFLSRTQMSRLAEEPEHFDRVDEKMKSLVDHLAVERLANQTFQTLTAGETITLNSPTEGQKFRILSPRVVRWGNTIALGSTPGHPVLVQVLTGNKLSRWMESYAGKIEIESGDHDRDPEPRARVVLNAVQVFDALSPGVSTQRTTMPLPRSYWPTPVAGPLQDMSPFALRSVAAEYSGSKAVAVASDDLAMEMLRLGRRINAELHQRAAAAVSAMLVLLLGAILSTLMRGNAPLVVFFWVFVLATIVVIITHSGTNMAADPGQNLIVSLILAWSGNLLLMGVTGFFYVKLTRN